MNDLWNRKEFCEDLTRDVLSDVELARMCAEAAGVARRRRLFMKARLAGGCALIATCGWFALGPDSNKFTRVPAVAPRAEASFRLVQSEPFQNVITSQPFASGLFVSSIEPAHEIATPPDPTYQEISDDELFRLLEGYSVALVRESSGKLKLEVLDGHEDQIQ